MDRITQRINGSERLVGSGFGVQHHRPLAQAVRPVRLPGSPKPLRGSTLIACSTSAVLAVERDDAGGIGQAAGEVGGECVVAADRLRLHPELLGLRQADGRGQQAGGTAAPERAIATARDAGGPAGHRVGDPVPNAAVGKGFRPDLWGRTARTVACRTARAAAAARAARTPRRPRVPQRPARRGCGCSVTTRAPVSAARVRRWRCSQGSRARPGARPR